MAFTEVYKTTTKVDPCVLPLAGHILLHPTEEVVLPDVVFLIQFFMLTKLHCFRPIKVTGLISTPIQKRPHSYKTTCK